MNVTGTLGGPKFVDLVYNNVLGRPPDPGGRAFWVAELSSGRRERGAVMVGFSESPEFVVKTGTTPPVPAAAISDGTHAGVPGTWRNVTNVNGCYWERL